MSDYIKWLRKGEKRIVLEDEISPKQNSKRKAEIGVHLHLYYQDLLDEFCEYFNNIPEKFDLYISCKEGADIASIRSCVKKIKHVGRVIVRETRNRGRDMAPFYVLFADDLLKYDIILHVHSKKSLYTGQERANWRHEALDGVLKNEKMVQETLRLMRSEQAGLVFGEMTSMLPLMALHWLYNTGKGAWLLDRIHIPFENGMFFYPVGSFFWAKKDAIKPIFDLKLQFHDFDEEVGQVDGTLAHALERVVSFVAKHRGYNMYIYDANSNEFSVNISYKCFKSYFAHNPKNLSERLIKDFDVISFDIFDTLITRLVYQPDDIFHLMSRKIKARFGKQIDFLFLRKKAESIAWSEKGDFCNIHHIYEKLPDISDFSKKEADELKQMEIDLEYDLCIPRQDVKVIFDALIAANKTIILISDMYLPRDIIANLLDKCGYRGYKELWISCDKGKRKDRDTIWDEYIDRYGEYRTIHIGDNPHSDCQIIGDRGRQYSLLLSPMDQFRLSSQYEKFSRFVNTTVENSLMLGFMINACFYNSPFALSEKGFARIKTVREISCGVFAPIMLKFMDYLHITSRKNSKLLFLAREGYFLEKLYVRYCEAFERIPHEHVYFLASRRATSVPQIEKLSDILELLEKHYSGRLSTILDERFGLEHTREDIQVTLPSDKIKILSAISKYTNEIVREAEDEKENYLEYINSILGDDIDWDEIVLVDVGYSGTIQYYLMKIVGERLDGCYMISGYDMKPEELGGTYRSLYTFWRDKSFLDAHLFLEAVLAAPHGQVIRFGNLNGRVEPILKKEKKIYGENAVILQKEIYEYVDMMGKILHDITPKIDGQLTECIFSEILREGIVDENLHGLFRVSDGYCSDGDIIFNESLSRWEKQADLKKRR